MIRREVVQLLWLMGLAIILACTAGKALEVPTTATPTQPCFELIWNRRSHPSLPPRERGCDEPMASLFLLARALIFPF